jgi:hypothetical protein
MGKRSMCDLGEESDQHGDAVQHSLAATAAAVMQNTIWQNTNKCAVLARVMMEQHIHLAADW